MTLLIVIASIVGYLIIASIYYSYIKVHITEYFEDSDWIIVALLWPLVLCCYLLCIPWIIGKKIYTFFKK